MDPKQNTIEAADAGIESSARTYDLGLKEEYVILIPNNIENIRLIHIFSTITPQDWFQYENQCRVSMRDVDGQASEFDVDTLEPAIALYDTKILRIEVWMKRDGVWAFTGRQFPKEKVSPLDKQSAVNGLARVDEEEEKLDPRSVDLDEFLTSGSQASIRLESVQNDRSIRGLTHIFKVVSTENVRRYNQISMRMQMMRGRKRPVTLFPSTLKEISKLYDELCVGFEGYSYAGDAIDSSIDISVRAAMMNPYHKKVALRILFQRESLKQGE